MRYFIRIAGDKTEVTINRSLYSDEILVEEYGYNIFDNDNTNIQCSDFDGLEFNAEKYNARNTESIKSELRLRRNKECFEIANRNFFFDEATAEDLSEIKMWYTAWLNVTVSPYAIPEMPKYIKDRI